MLRTGFNTAKGSMVQSILFPKPINIKFESDGLKLGCPHFLGMLITSIEFYTFHRGNPICSLLVSCQSLDYLDLYFQQL